MRKKNKFLTFMFACLPGAGHMYLGFMKLGLSFMILFFGVGGLGLLANEILYVLTGPIFMILPVIWFYAFFDCINKNGAGDEEFASYEDHYLFTDVPELRNIDWRSNFGFLTSKAPRIAIGFIILISGISMLCRNLLSIINWYYYEELQIIFEILHSILDRLPQVAISVAIIVLGIWLIAGKRKELKHEVREIRELTQAVQNIEQEDKPAEPVTEEPKQEIQNTEEPINHEA